jgi:hypothetical protein
VAARVAHHEGVCLPLTGVLLLLGPVFVLIAAMAGLAAHGPLGVIASGALLLSSVWGSAWTARATWRWWGRLGPPPPA